MNGYRLLAYAIIVTGVMKMYPDESMSECIERADILFDTALLKSGVKR